MKPDPQRLYATDGKCHNAEVGTFGHECGKPATWVGTTPTGFQSGFCDHCKEHGGEARQFTSWQRLRADSEVSKALREIIAAVRAEVGPRLVSRTLMEAVQFGETALAALDRPIKSEGDNSPGSR